MSDSISECSRQTAWAFDLSTLCRLLRASDAGKAESTLFLWLFLTLNIWPNAQTTTTLRDTNQNSANFGKDETPEKQVKSKKRVSDHGEVFTAEREVNAMLDLVKQETERIDSRFLEPACGDGNFLVEILRRKLAVVESRYSKSQLEWERYAVIAVSSIYGVDILKDNVLDCQERLFVIFETDYSRLFKAECKEECSKSVRFILRRNILWGDALSLKTPDEKAQPIVFSEWSAVNGSLIKRRDYTLANLLENQPISAPNLFSDLGDRAFIPNPVADFPLIHFLKIGEDAGNEL